MGKAAPVTFWLIFCAFRLIINKKEYVGKAVMKNTSEAKEKMNELFHLVLSASHFKYRASSFPLPQGTESHTAAL